MQLELCALFFWRQTAAIVSVTALHEVCYTPVALQGHTAAQGWSVGLGVQIPITMT